MMLAFDEQATRLLLGRARLKTATASVTRKASNTLKTELKNTRKPQHVRRKLRILCLHGYEQNTDSFRTKTGALRRAGKKYAEFTFLQGPNGIVRDGVSTDSFAWYVPLPDSSTETLSYEDDTNTSTRAWSRQLDESSWHDSLQSIAKAFETEGPFDGVLGFSQGAAMAAALCHLQLHEGRAAPLDLVKFQFACFFSGFTPAHGFNVGGEEVDKIGTTSPFSCFHSLHVWGTSDEIINSRRSKSLATDYFGLGTSNGNAVCLEHKGGHLVPSDKHIRDGFQDFLHSQRDRILAVE